MDDVYQQTVTDIRNGVRFVGWLLVKEATVRQTASGKSFLDMRLVDCTGVVPGKFWDYTGDAPAVGTVVYVEGLGNLYNGHLQLRVDSFRAAVPEDGKQASDFIPSAPETPESMLEEILSCARALRDDSLRGITLQLLTWANADGRLLTSPAAKSMHHAELGGLLHHTVTILRAARALMSVYPGLDKDLLYAGVIAHDLGKLDEMQTNELGLVDAYTVDGHLIGHLVRGVVNIERAASDYIRLQALLEDKHNLETRLEEKEPGVVTGLAWTTAGGEILFIESKLMEGKGNLIITGQLGDVMKESVQIALSLVKGLYPKETAVLEKNDLHIHVPAGAVPKDGPSAGITLVTALASLVTGRPADPDCAMTGEVSLRGGVMPIGGLPEKLMAAQRAGISRVYIPAENVDDLDEVAEEVKEKLEIIPVKTVTEVLDRVLLSKETEK